jgi:hypothetical protein
MEAQDLPILIVALLALAAFAVVGGLLTAAAVLETKKANAARDARKFPAHKPAA